MEVAQASACGFSAEYHGGNPQAEACATENKGFAREFLPVRPNDFRRGRDAVFPRGLAMGL
jgi:hypothetical protein